MGCRAANIDLIEEELAGLGRLIRTLSTPQQLALRARIILLASDGVGFEETAERLPEIEGDKPAKQKFRRYLLSGKRLRHD